MSDLRADLLALANRRLSAAEFDAYANAAMSPDERDEILSLIAWFCRRYPTPLDRLRSSRAAYAAVARRET